MLLNEEKKLNTYALYLVIIVIFLCFSTGSFAVRWSTKSTTILASLSL